MEKAKYNSTSKSCRCNCGVQTRVTKNADCQSCPRVTVESYYSCFYFESFKYDLIWNKSRLEKFYEFVSWKSPRQEACRSVSLAIGRLGNPRLASKNFCSLWHSLVLMLIYFKHKHWITFVLSSIQTIKVVCPKACCSTVSSYRRAICAQPSQPHSFG